MKLAELIISEARERGIRHFFGIPGGGCPLDLMEYGRRLGVEFVSVAHESTAAIAGAYNGLMKDTAGLALSVKGVGAGNLAGGAVNAYFERAPVICLCESSPSTVTRGGLVQQCAHEELFGSVIKYSGTLSPDSAPGMLREATFRALDGRPGPVLLDLPSDLGAADCGGPLTPLPVGTDGPPATPSIEAARAFLERSSKPAVVAGADVIRAGATPALVELVERIGGVVLSTMDGRGAFPESHPRWAGVMTGSWVDNTVEMEVIERADAVLFAGVDAMMAHVPWSSPLPVCELVARPGYLSFTPEPEVRVDGDLKASIAQLTTAGDGFFEAELAAIDAAVEPHFARPPHARLAAQDIIEIARELMPPGGVLFSETGIYITILERLWKVDDPASYRGTSGGRTMGLTIPAILGAKLAAPETPMMGLGADGSLLMRLGELETLARAGVAVPLVILNDDALGTMKWRQKARGMPEYKLQLQRVDYAEVARCCGLAGATVDTPEGFREALKAAFSADVGTLIDCRLDAQAYQDSFGPTIGVLDA